MHEYDIALKLLLQSNSGLLLRQLTGGGVSRWLNTELPQVRTSRADLLGVADDGRLVHIELQSSNDSTMAFRMAQYALAIFGRYDRYPAQVVLYVGEPALRMPASFIQPDAADPKLVFNYALVDIREFDPASLLASPYIEDNLLAILTNLQNQVAAVREILLRIADLEETLRPAAFAQLLIISGLRQLAPTIEKEVQTMPILNDILDHEVIGPAILKGRREGIEEGLKEGLKEGSKSILRHQLQRRFGPLSPAMEGRMASLTATELTEIAIRVLEVSSLEELFSVQ